MIIDPLKCGGCGCDTVRVFNQRPHDSGRDQFDKIIFECTECLSRSSIQITQPRIMIESASCDPDVINMAKGNDMGTLCGGWER